MSRPKVELDNFEAVYRYYESHEQNKAFAKFAHTVLSRVYKVSITADEGAGDAISQALANGARIVISPNHLTGDDQYVIVSTAETFEPLRPIGGRAFIPSEPSLFRRRGWQGKLLRNSCDGLGALPTFRLEDLRRQGVEITDEINQQYRDAIELASKTQVSKLVAGHSMAGFWEGTRNRTDHRVVQPLKKGVAHTAIAAAEKVPVVLLPMGFYYGQEPEDYKKPVLPGAKRPYVHIGMPIPVETTDPDELVALLHPEIQRCVDIVVERAGGQPLSKAETEAA